MTKKKTKTFWEHLLRAILETWDIWDTDYNSDNWEPEFITIFVTWQLIVTLDSIRNSCDVYINVSAKAVVHWWTNACTQQCKYVVCKFVNTESPQRKTTSGKGFYMSICVVGKMKKHSFSTSCQWAEQATTPVIYTKSSNVFGNYVFKAHPFHCCYYSIDTIETWNIMTLHVM